MNNPRSYFEKHKPRKPIWLCLFICLILFSSCEKDINGIQLPDVRKPSVYCLFSQDTSMNLYLYESPLFSDTNQIRPISNAIISLHENSNKITDFRFFENKIIPYYSTNYRAEHSSQLKLNISFSEYEIIEATTTIPPLTQISNLSYALDPSWGNVYNHRRKFRFQMDIHDLPGRDYYMIKASFPAFDKSEGADSTKLVQWYYPYIQSQEFQNIFISYPENSIFFDDSFLDGEIFTFSGTLSCNMQPRTETEPKVSLRLNTEQVRIEFIHLSEEAFLFHKSYYLMIEAQNQVFFEPSSTYSNIEGGYGIFAGSSINTVFGDFIEE